MPNLCIVYKICRSIKNNDDDDENEEGNGTDRKSFASLKSV